VRAASGSVPERGVHGAGEKSRDPNAPVAYLGSQRQGETVGAELRGAVGGRVGERVFRSDGEHVDDLAFAAGKHLGYGVLAAEVRAGEIHRKRRVPIRALGRLDGPEPAVASRVYHGIDTAALRA